MTMIMNNAVYREAHRTSYRCRTRPIPGGGGSKPKAALASALLSALVFCLPALVPSQSYAQDVVGSFESVSVSISKTKQVSMPTRFSELVVGDPAIAEIVPLTNTSFYLVGKQIGSTNVSVYGGGKRLQTVLNISVTPDLETLKQRLFEVMPTERVEVRGLGESIVLSGSVRHAGQARSAVKLAEQVAFGPEKVVNMITVSGTQQVMLAVRFAEIVRDAAEAIGVSFIDPFDSTAGAVFNGAGGSTADFFTGALPAADSFGVLTGSFGAGELSFTATLEALEERGVATVLAEPNLIAMSGETASFLAGGEFPIPVATDAGDGAGIDVTIEFKEFGVRLFFTPTVLTDSLINLTVSPEVSALDPANGIVSEGIVIPGLTTRRAKTTVELKHGQSFAIAGLLSKDFRDSIQQLPGLGDIPILGALFKSASYERGETELVIIVTPYLVEPSTLDKLTTPMDTFLAPSILNLWLLGQVERRITRAPIETFAPTVQPVAAQTVEEGGIDGSYGYVVN